MDPKNKFNEKLIQEAKDRLYRERSSSTAVNDKILKMEKHVVNKYSKRFVGVALVFAVLMPPYVLHWKDQQMAVS